MKAFSKIPFYRIMIPFVLGIICCVFTKLSFQYYPLFFSLIIIILLFAFKNKQQKKVIKWIWLILLDVVLFNLGLIITQQKDARLNSQHVSHSVMYDSAQFYIAELLELLHKHLKLHEILLILTWNIMTVVERRLLIIP